MNIEHPPASQAKRCGQVERPTSNIEWGKMKKQTYDLEERLIEYSARFLRAMLLPGFLKLLR